MIPKHLEGKKGIFEIHKFNVKNDEIEKI